MSTNIKNPKDQDDCKKGTLSNQPQVMCVMPTALLGTDFEMHTYMQGYGEEHLRPVNAVTRLFGDGDLDVDHCNEKASAAKEFVARKKPHEDRESSHAQERQLEIIVMTNKLGKSQVEVEAMASRAHELIRTKAQGTYWDRLSANSALEILGEMSKDKQQSTLIHKFGNPLRIPCLRCTVRT
jgi:hypothetical protein